MTTTRRRLRLAAIASSVVLVLASCGGDGDTTATDSPQATETMAPDMTSSSMAHDTGDDMDAAMAGGASSAAATLRSVLTAQLQEHVYLAGIAVYNAVINPDAFAASADVLDLNSQDLAGSIASVYGDDAGATFLELWRTHIGFFVDYTTAAVAGDAAGQQAAADDLTQYTQDFGAFLAAANPGLTQEAVADLVGEHVATLVPAVDAIVAGDPATAFGSLKTAAGHMSVIAEALAGAIAAQFPDQFSG